MVLLLFVVAILDEGGNSIRGDGHATVAVVFGVVVVVAVVVVVVVGHGGGGGVVLRTQKLRTPPVGSPGLSKVPSCLITLE